MLWLHGIQHHWIQESSVCGTCVCVSVCLCVAGLECYLVQRPAPGPVEWRPREMPPYHICYPPDIHNNCSKHESWFECTYMYIKVGSCHTTTKKTQNKMEERHWFKEKWKLQLKWLSQSVCFGYESCVTGYQVLELPLLSLTAVELTGDYRWQVRPVFTWQMYNPTNWLHANYKLISNRLNLRDQLFDASVISCTIMYWALLSIECISVWQVLINGVISIQDSQVSAAQVLCNKVAVYLLHQQAGASTSTCCSVLSTECQ